MFVTEMRDREWSFFYNFPFIRASMIVRTFLMKSP